MTTDQELRASGAATALWAFLFLVFATVPFVVAYETAMHFTGVAIDGPFQLYNALRRIQAGYSPGVDFQFFHGFGVPYLHYWLFRLLGGGLRGSELARETITALAYPLVCLVFFRVFAGTWTRAFCLTAAAIALSFLLKLSAVLFALNGMLGLRAALPTLIPVVLYLSPTSRWRIVATGLALGVALFVSTEQGLAVVMAYLVVSALALLRRTTRREQVIESASTVAIAAATLVSLLVIIGGFAGMRGALRYNFSVVPMDQYWFFGSPPNLFIESWRAAVHIAFAVPFVSLSVLLGIVAAAVYGARFWRAPEGPTGERNFALAVLPVYGVISTASLLGAFATAYVQPCWRVLILIAGIEATSFALRRDRRLNRPSSHRVPRAIAVASLLICAWSVFKIRLIPRSLLVSLPHIVSDHLAGEARFGVAGIWPQTLRDAQQAIDAHRGPNGAVPTLWSTYAGWIEARNGIFHPSFDYIIHALGPDSRRAYVTKFRSTRPELVQTVLPSYTPYETWIENNDWSFYDELLRWYTVSSTTPWSIFWERRAAPSPEPMPLGAMTVPAGMMTVPLPPIPADSTAPATLLEVDVRYEVHNPLRRLPIIGASPRYLIGIGGAVSRLPISLDPYVGETRFPLLVRAGQKPVLHFQTFSLLPGASWRPIELRVSVRPVDERNRAWLSSLVSRDTL